MHPEPDARTVRSQRADTRRELAAARQRAGRNAWWRRGFRKLRRGLGGITTRLLLPAFLRALGSTWRVRRIGVENLERARAGDGFLAAMWHGDMLAPLPIHRRMGVGVLVSPSGDGELVRLVLERFGYAVIRGSSSKGSARALRAMKAHLGAGGSVVITPDGPRGPRQTMNLGLAWLARETRCPILPLRVECDRAWRLKSWDRFQIPKPWARVTIEYGELLEVSPAADDDELERATELIRTRLQERSGESWRLGSAPCTSGTSASSRPTSPTRG